MSTSYLGPLLESNYCVIVVSVKLCLGVIDTIEYIGSVAKPLFILIRGEGFSPI